MNFVGSMWTLPAVRKRNLTFSSTVFPSFLSSFLLLSSVHEHLSDIVLSWLYPGPVFKSLSPRRACDNAVRPRGTMGQGPPYSGVRFVLVQGRKPGKWGEKSPCRERNSLVCRGPETWEHTAYSGRDSIIGGFCQTKQMEGISVGGDGYKPQ